MKYMSKDTAKRAKIGMLVFSLLVMGAAIHKGVSTTPEVDPLQSTNPDVLQRENTEARAAWAAKCISDSSFLAQKTNINNYPDYCTQSAFKLYPEKIWVEVSRYNSILYKKH